MSAAKANAAPRRNNAKNGNAANTGAGLVAFLFRLQIGVKMSHWQTRSYAAHMDTGALFDSIVKLTDEIIEQYMGVYGRPRMPASASVPVPNMTKSATVALLREGITYLRTRMPPDPNLRNLADELAGEMAKALYLMTMR